MAELSIIISCRNDVVGTVITINSILEELKTGINGEIVVCNNSDEIKHWAILKNLIPEEHKLSGKIKLFNQQFPCIFTAREKAINNMTGKYLLVLDSHCLLSKGFLKVMLDTLKNRKNLGFLYGLMCFSRDHEKNSFCDRDIDTFIGIRHFKYDYKKVDEFEVPFRGMPFMCSKKFWRKIGGYGTLAEHFLPWGGGDFALGLKSAMLGFRNLMTTKAMAIHLGPFKNSKYFPASYIREKGNTFPARFGMLVTAYIIGGEKLLMKRIQQLSDRLGFESLTGEDIDKAIMLGSKERQWLLNSAKYSYADLVTKFKPMQVQSSTQPIGRAPLPLADGTLVDKTMYKETRKYQPPPKPGRDSWRDRIDPLFFKQSGAIA